MDFDRLIDHDEITLDVIDEMFSFLDYNRVQNHPTSWILITRSTIKYLVLKEKVPSQFAKEIFPWGIELTNTQMHELKLVLAASLIIKANNYDLVDATSVFGFYRKNDLGLISEAQMKMFLEGNLVKNLEFDPEEFYLKTKDLAGMNVNDLYLTMRDFSK